MGFPSSRIDNACLAPNVSRLDCAKGLISAAFLDRGEPRRHNVAARGIGPGRARSFCVSAAAKQLKPFT